MSRRSTDMLTAWHKAEDAVADIGAARRSAEHAVEDALDALRALRHRDDKAWKARRTARRKASRAGDRLRESASATGEIVDAGRLVAFLAGAATGLVAGWWLARALADTDVRASAGKLLTPVAEKSREAVERPRAAVSAAVQRPAAAVRSIVTSDDGPDGSGLAEPDEERAAPAEG